MNIDGNGIALIIGACAAGLVTVGTFSMQVITFIDTRKLKRLSLARDAQIATVKELVNGKSEQLNAAMCKDAFEAGRMHERVMPDHPSPAAVSVVLTPLPAPVLVSEDGKPTDRNPNG